MSTLILENMPEDVLNRLKRQAAQKSRTPAEEASHLIELGLREATNPRLPDYVPGDEITTPCDLPRPGKGEKISCTDGGKRLPDPPIIMEE